MSFSATTTSGSPCMRRDCSDGHEQIPVGWSTIPGERRFLLKLIMTFNTINPQKVALLVCHCHRVCDRVIRECVDGGARSLDDIGRACGAGTACGGCQPTIGA